MWKLSLTLFVIAASISFFVGKESVQCKKNFHKVCGFSDVITFVNQTKCPQKSVVEGADKSFCQWYEEPQLFLNVDDFSAIAPYAFNATNFIGLELKSGSETCKQKIIDSTPESFDGLSSLQHLHLDCAKFPSTPNILKNLVSLDELIMSRLEFTNVPEYYLPDLPKLTRLTLEKVNITAITPATLSQINRKLEYLHLKSNNLTIVEGKSFQKLHFIRILKIEDNHLTDLHPDMFDGLDALKMLILKGNNITALRKNTFSKLSQLEHVDLSRNAIREIEIGTFSGLPIQKLELSDNELEDLPVGVFKNFPNLMSLSFYGNKISIVRKNVFQGLGEATQLSLGHNNIHHIESTAFGGLHLYSLSLIQNKLNVLEPDTFNGLRVETSVDISCNNITEIKEQAFRNLTAKSVKLPRNITEIRRDRWGADDSVGKIDISKRPCPCHNCIIIQISGESISVD